MTRIDIDTPPYAAIGTLRLPAVPALGTPMNVMIDGAERLGTVTGVIYTPHNSTPVRIKLNFVSGPVQAGNAIGDQIEASVDFQARVYEKSIAYNNVITLAGYAGVFAIWGFVKEKLSTHASLTVALLLGASVLIFVLQELFGMYARTRRAIAVAEAYKGPSEKYFQMVLEFERQERKRSMLSSKLWRVWFTLSAACGISSALILFYDVIADLTSWPQVPH